MTKWICRKCGSNAESYKSICIKYGSNAGSYKNKQGKWFSCSNDECENYNRMRREGDIDFLEYLKEA